MRVLVACEYSGVVRRAFLNRGCDAWSCDLLPAEDGSTRHIQGDARTLLADGWDLLVAHPPCTRLANSGVRWLRNPPPGKTLTQMQKELEEGAELFSAFWNAPIPRICVENPVMHGHAKALINGYVAPAQSVQPWQFGHPECKRTCFWLKNLPPPLSPPTSWMAGSNGSIGCHQVQTGGRNGRGSTQASPLRWQINGSTRGLDRHGAVVRKNESRRRKPPAP